MAERPTIAPPAGSARADDLVDELVGGDLDWQDLVVRYPRTALALAALGGYLLGRSRGQEILGALSNYAADSVQRNVNAILGEDVL